MNTRRTECVLLNI